MRILSRQDHNPLAEADGRLYRLLRPGQGFWLHTADFLQGPVFEEIMENGWVIPHGDVIPCPLGGMMREVCRIEPVLRPKEFSVEQWHAMLSFVVHLNRWMREHPRNMHNLWAADCWISNFTFMGGRPVVMDAGMFSQATTEHAICSTLHWEMQTFRVRFPAGCAPERELDRWDEQLKKHALRHF